MENNNNKNIGRQMVGKVLAMLIVSSIIIGIISIGLYRSDNIESSKEYAKYITESIRSRIDAEEMLGVIEAEETNGYWLTIKNYLNDVKASTDVEYLYVAYFKGDDIYYFAEGIKKSDDATDIASFGDKASPDEFASKVIASARKGEPTAEYENVQNYGRLIEGTSSIVDAGGDVIGFVGVDIDGSEVFYGTLKFVACILGTIIFICVLMGLIFRRNVNKFISQPIMQITDAAHGLAVGEIDINIDTEVRNEIGILRDAFRSISEATKRQSEILRKMAQGDYREHIEIRSNKDVMNKSINELLDSNIKSVSSIREIAEQVANGASEIESGAQTVAEGANEQAGSVEEFRSIIDNLTNVAKQNSNSVSEVNRETMLAAERLAETGNIMDDLVKSLEQVAGSAKEITKIMQLIDTIAFQTNILSLNAAVEAARAGQHGKGFAVVADEVRTLATKSADAAKETEAMLAANFSNMENESDKAALGNESIQRVTEAAEVVRTSVQKIDDDAQRQAEAIEDMMVRIEEFSAVIQKNSTMSEESATSATYLTSLANEMKEAMEKFYYTEEDVKRLSGKGPQNTN